MIVTIIVAAIAVAALTLGLITRSLLLYVVGRVVNLRQIQRLARRAPALGQPTRPPAGGHAMSHAAPADQDREFADGDRVNFRDADGTLVEGVVFGLCLNVEVSVCIHYVVPVWGDKYVSLRPGDVHLLEAAPSTPNHHPEEEHR